MRRAKSWERDTREGGGVDDIKAVRREVKGHVDMLNVVVCVGMQ